jgi:hypothetical protein
VGDPVPDGGVHLPAVVDHPRVVHGFEVLQLSGTVGARGTFDGFLQSQKALAVSRLRYAGAMAQTVIVKLTDDIDGGDAHETVSFALNGQRYEIDLNENNAKALRDALGPFIEKARPVRGAPVLSRTKRSATQAEPISPRQKSSSPKTLFSGLDSEEKERFRQWAKMPTARRIGDGRVQEWIDAGRP